MPAVTEIQKRGIGVFAGYLMVNTLARTLVLVCLIPLLGDVNSHADDDGAAEYDRCRKSCNVFSGFSQCLDRCIKSYQATLSVYQEPDRSAAKKRPGEYTFQDSMTDSTNCVTDCSGRSDVGQCVTACHQRVQQKLEKGKQIRAARAHKEELSRDLKKPPFAFPDALPQPKDAFEVRVTNPLKGDKAFITFKTKLPLDVLAKFYLESMRKHGLRSMPTFSGQADEHFNLRFAGWPGFRAISISAFDEAYRSSSDYRFVTATISGR